MDQMNTEKCCYLLILMTAIGSFFQWPVVQNVQKSVLHLYSFETTEWHEPHIGTYKKD
jgi:hypothetical protein